MENSFSSLLASASLSTDEFTPREILAIVEDLNEENHIEVTKKALTFLITKVVGNQFEKWHPLFSSRLIQDHGFRNIYDMRGFISIQLHQLKTELMITESFNGDIFQKVVFALIKGVQFVSLKS